MSKPAVSWQSVRADALRRIQCRDWPPGALIPHEADLAREFGCARTTVNRALRDLAEAGYLERKRKGGTRVALTPVRKATFEIAIIRHDIEARGHVYGYKLLSDQPAALVPAPLRGALSLPPLAQMRYICAVHLAGDVPFCLESRWLNPALVDADQRFDTLSANEWLVRNLPLSRGAFALSAIAADAGLAAQLGCAQGAALLRVERTTFQDSQPITAVTLTYGPGFQMQTDIA